jgi:hypothetical protein
MLKRLAESSAPMTGAPSGMEAHRKASTGPSVGWLGRCCAVASAHRMSLLSRSPRLCTNAREACAGPNWALILLALDCPACLLLHVLAICTGSTGQQGASPRKEDCQVCKTSSSRPRISADFYKTALLISHPRIPACWTSIRDHCLSTASAALEMKIKASRGNSRSNSGSNAVAIAVAIGPSPVGDLSRQF